MPLQGGSCAPPTVHAATSRVSMVVTLGCPSHGGGPGVLLSPLRAWDAPQLRTMQSPVSALLRGRSPVVGGVEPKGKAGEQRGAHRTRSPRGTLERARVTPQLPHLGQGSWGSCTPHLWVIGLGLLPWGRYSQVPLAPADPGQVGASCRRAAARGPRAQGAGCGGAELGKSWSPGCHSAAAGTC